MYAVSNAAVLTQVILACLVLFYLLPTHILIMVRSVRTFRMVHILCASLVMVISDVFISVTIC